MVPGLLKQKIEALIRSLPRTIRKNFIPVSEFSEACFQRINSAGNLYDELQQALQQMTGIQVSTTDWQQAQIERHLNMHYWLEDNGKCVAQSNDLQALQEQYGAQANASFEQHVQHDESIARSGLSDWDFDRWESQVTMRQNNQNICAYPALVDYEDTVSIELFETEADASFYHATGVTRLIYLRLTPTIKYLTKNLPNIAATALMYSSMASKSELIEDLLFASVFACFLPDHLPDCRQAFDDCIRQNESQFIDKANQIAELTHQILTLYRALNSALDEVELPPDHLQDIHQQCEHLVYAGFLRDISIKNLARIPSYIQAIQKRIQNYKSGSTQIDSNLVSARLYWDRYLAFSENEKIDARKLTELRWMIEEFRIACFAQPMKTRIPVSEKKLDKLISTIQAA